MNKIASSRALYACFLLGISQPTWAFSSLDTDVGLDVVATRNAARLLDCDTSTFDRRGLLALRPLVKDRESSYQATLTGRGLLSPSNTLRPYAAEGSANAEVHRGFHAVQIGLASSYLNSELWDCSASVIERLKRQRDIQNRVIIPGASTHERAANASYVYGRAGELWSLLYTGSSLVAFQSYVSQDLNARFDHVFNRQLKTAVTVGTGNRTGTFDRFTMVHGALSLAYQVDGVTDLLASSDGESRSNAEQHLTSSAQINHRSSRVWSERAAWASRKVLHSKISSEREGMVAATSTVESLKFDLAAHRLEADDLLHSAGSWYNFVATENLSRQQALSIQTSYGSEQPVLMQFMSSWGVAYSAVLGPPPGRPGRADPRWTLTSSYQETVLIDRQKTSNSVRQVRAGVEATF